MMQMSSGIVLGALLLMPVGQVYANRLSRDPLTGLPLPAATDAGGSGSLPTEMPPGTICTSQYHGNNYELADITLDAATAWYVSTLNGFKHIQSADRNSHIFANADRSVIVVVMGSAGGAARAASYETYNPGLTENELTGFLDGKEVECR
jgi:hypothetical protein